jgi:hypothetical protein
MLDMPRFIGFLKVGKMAWRMDEIEALTIKYKPERITTLFVGESAPRSGDFFYSWKRTRFRTNIEEAIKLAKLRGDCDFFKDQMKAKLPGLPRSPNCG